MHHHSLDRGSGGGVPPKWQREWELSSSPNYEIRRGGGWALLDGFAKAVANQS